LITTYATWGYQTSLFLFSDINDIPQSSANCTNLSLSKAEASGSERRYPASNAIDNKLNTRWSNVGLPSWIEVDLGSSQNVCYVDISWYRGNLRVNTFTISTSNDGDNYEDIFTDDSSGTTKSFERYNVPPDTKARFLRITVTGNSEGNNYASISELDVYGSIPKEICDNSIDDDGDGLIDIADSDCQQSGGGGGTVDPFGIAKIYPTKSSGEEWYMDMNNPSSDPRTNPPSMTKNSHGTWKVTSTTVSFRIFPSNGWDRDYTTLNQEELAQKGYMEDPNDWKNVEMTGYIKANSATTGSIADTTKFVWYNRGGHHSDSQPCEGTAYKGNLFYDGRTRFQKEQWHDGGYFTSPTIAAVGHLDDRWVGFKYVVYNFVQNGKQVVKMQNWIDNNNNGNWVKINERIDSGGWGTEGDHCGGTPDQLITWGGPLASFRWDRATNVDIKNFSVREIQPPSS
jgi:hypothetical protein